LASAGLPEDEALLRRVRLATVVRRQG
jgi:hypothetical protein